MREVEQHMDEHLETQDPLCLVAFSISASEPRMMILRNLCGKMQAWVNRRQFVFESTAMARRVHIFDDISKPGPKRSSSRSLANEKEAKVQSEHAQRLAALYARYDPAKVPNVDWLMSKYQGREDELIDAVVSKYRVPGSAVHTE